MNMKESAFPSPQAVNVDWDAPHLQTLLEKTEAWQLDTRGGSKPEKAKVFIGWGAMAGKSGIIVWEDEAAVVLQTTSPLLIGERVRVEKHIADQIRSIWSEVVQSRPGQRTSDHVHGLHIHWLRKLTVGH
ncbi:hypothetical protein B2A_15805 [mine drainage metagenome]|uniref:Uncharacterized protein n=1 Tax=mine drainage metagenome TaxID=410659 RepID=T0XYR6_9ZZZZ